MSNRKKSLFLLIGAFTVVTIIVSPRAAAPRVEPASTPPFDVDTSKAFHFELGRGSGWHGLDTITFGMDGLTTLHRQSREHGWETASITLPPDAIRRIFTCVHDEGIMRLAAAYHADIYDGTQWILWITQADQSKAVYLNNHFPRAVRHLASKVDSELESAGLSLISWTPVPMESWRKHEKKIWDSIKKH